MRLSEVTIFFLCILIGAGTVLAQSTPILIGGEDTELSEEGVISGNGSTDRGGLGAAVLDEFTIHYQPLGEGDWTDNQFPDPEFYSFQMDIPDGLPDYQCQGVVGDWDSRGRNGEGELPWINEDHEWYDQQYRPTGEEPLFGLVNSDARWTINYWGPERDNRFKHTCLAGTVEDFHFDDETGDATALLLLFESAYLGYGEDNEPGPGVVDYPGGAYQGFDIHKEASGTFSHRAFFFEYDGENSTGSLTPCGTKITHENEDGWVLGYFDGIQDAIDAAEDGDQILVQPGEYIGNINFDGKAISLIGNPDDPTETIIDADRNGRSVVAIREGEDENTVLSGFTIRNGETDYGGGIYCNGTSPTLQYLIIEDNEVERVGGGIYCTNEAAPSISYSIIRNNVAGTTGGGVSSYNGAHPTLEYVLIYGNSANSNGGGLQCNISSSTLINVTISNNRVETGSGDGIYCYDQDNVIDMVNCIAYGHENTDIYLNTGEINVAYSAVGEVEGAVDLGEGVIRDDPLFIDPDDDNYLLQRNSPCIDTGDPDSPEDEDGTRIDMGALPYVHLSYLYGWVLDADTDEPLQGAAVITTLGDTAQTDAEGFWEIPEAFFGDFDITASAQGYNDSTITDIHTEQFDTLEINFGLLFPTCEASVELLNSDVALGESVDLPFSLRNDGAGLLEFSVERRLSDLWATDPFDLHFSYNVGEEVDDSRIQGVVFIDGRFYVAGGGNDINNIYIFDRDGELIDLFRQFDDESRYGMSGMTWDGELIWGVDDQTVYGFRTDGELVSSFEADVPRYTKSIAWDPARELLWTAAQRSDNIVGLDRDGNVEMEIDQCGFRLYGLAYWPEEPDYPLYIVQRVEDEQYVYKMNPDNQADTVFVTSMNTEGEKLLSDAFITDQFDPYGGWTFMVVESRSDGLDFYQLQANLDWMQLEPDGEGVIAAHQEQEFTLTLDAMELDTNVYEGAIVFSHNADDGLLEIPVAMTVVDPDVVDGSDTAVPVEFGLSAIYPNPFNAIMTVRFNLARTGMTRLTVFDVSGRAVDVILDNGLKAGSHRAIWNAERFTTGVYFIQLEQDGYVQVRKVLLIR